MKPLSTLVLGALLTSGAAIAATIPSRSAPTATPAATVAPVAKQNSTLHCEKAAKARGLTGDAGKTFVKNCRAGRRAG